MMRDWDDAFANFPYIPGSEKLPQIWADRAAAYRRSRHDLREDISYGTAARQRMDLILPEGETKGLVAFVHGGFWHRFGKSDWTDVAEGARANGWAVALPGYTLAPEARITEMTMEIAAAITKAATLVEGPIRLMGHSAGGHLVTRMICEDSPLPPEILHRIAKVVSISGVHDLRPLRETKMNHKLSLTPAEAAAESPALLMPIPFARLTCWVGADERPEFIRQSRLMATIWDGPAKTTLVEEPGQNHVSILEGLKAALSPIVRELLAD